MVLKCMVLKLFLYSLHKSSCCKTEFASSTFKGAPRGKRRNGRSPLKDIIKKVTQTMIKSPFKAVKW